MARFRATVRRVTEKTTHLQRVPTLDGLQDIRLPDPIVVEVVEQYGAFYLLRLDEDGQCIADTWHESLEGAKAQASFEFDIKEADWEEVKSN